MNPGYQQQPPGGYQQQPYQQQPVAPMVGGGGGGGAASMKKNPILLAAGGLLALFVLCNWLVCLALWMSARVDSDIAKCAVIFWCLLAFIASGFEHSVANMTLLGLALAGHHPETVSIAGFAWNLGWVTLGNVIGGALFVGGAYYVSTYGFPRPALAQAAATHQVGDD